MDHPRNQQHWSPLPGSLPSDAVALLTALCLRLVLAITTCEDNARDPLNALLEDRSTNRLVESRSIFETIVNNRCFAEVSIILFFNKTDLLREKLLSGTTSIADYIENFRGDPHNLGDVQRFLVNWFYQARRSQHKPLFHHFTTAVDTENIKVVFNAVRDTILQKNITQLMLQ
ncbi:hypothetical protein HPB49_015403 [Dermacentor silvarum]|uniref:Uncharacterized protein n=1 Tax=Dermacentor silvarum TaxID=543639 RepID=A0ACB8CRV1_DERSI|nr:hypothetical protein HPB49_015403 [Dermacentor silvarum]